MTTCMKRLSTGIYSPHITHLLHVTDMSTKYMAEDGFLKIQLLHQKTRSIGCS